MTQSPFVHYQAYFIQFVRFNFEIFFRYLIFALSKSIHHARIDSCFNAKTMLKCVKINKIRGFVDWFDGDWFGEVREFPYLCSTKK